ncbi:hypothetical protein HTV45_32575 [Streptomyces sp. CHD11]|uniref:hypothetical protein n=1 Tax=Streptomyces sp. CHD11 TaxID=2741325 RepID=UPI001BFC968B|nr:hypothetical protein [Streptomyces sp. CHD11]MBT3155522.1 hypothetical protein [Streptomyces sp. CHD11]
MPRHAVGRAPARRRVRPLALAGLVAACVIALPPAVESTGPDGRGHAAEPFAPESPAVSSVRPVARPAVRGEGEAWTGPAAEPSPSGPHPSTAVRCGPALSSPEGIEAQTCVVARGEDIWARAYYRNTTGAGWVVALSLMGPGGRTVLTRCAVDAGDEPDLCETPRERGRGGLARYTAVAEFTDRPGAGRPLLRSGSN